MKQNSHLVHLLSMEVAVSPLADSEQRLLDLIRKRDEEAFLALVAEFDLAMLRLALVVARNRDIAEEAVQDTWVRVWQDPPMLRDAKSLRGWLFTVTANNARQALRRQRRLFGLWEARGMRDPSRPVDESETIIDTERALRTLSAMDRQVLALRFVAGLSSAQIGEQLGKSPEAIRSRMHRAVSRLRKELRT